MDDVLDEWSYAILTWETGDAKENIHNQQKIRCFFLGSPCFCLNQVVQRRDIALKIKEVSEKVDEIANERARHGLQINRGTDEIQRLISTSLVDELNVCGRDDEKKIIVSKLLNEMDDNNLGKASVETSIERVRHLSMMLPGETSFPSSIHRAKGLRSLLIRNTRGSSRLRAALPDVMKQLTCIRSLNMSGSSIEEIPKEVGKLIHLRHLNLNDCRELVSLPETMCDLCNLQSLDVMWCCSLKKLPLATVKLVNLRHLCIDGSGVAFMPKGIERLTCLRTLDCFIVCGGGENESKAANLRELRNLHHIGGSLKIRNLQGGGIEDAAEAQLKNKKRLLCLELNFCVNYEDDILFEALQPPSDLEILTIKSYGGIVLPNWMMALTRLQELTLEGCGNLEVLPSLGRLPNLESLELELVGVRRLDAGFLGIEEVENANNINEVEIARVTAFPKLKTLVISFLFKLKEWDGIERRVGEEDATTISIFIMPQLQQLEIFGCPLLRALPDYVLAAPLQVLEITDCPNLMKRYGKEEKGEDWHKISHIPKVIGMLKKIFTNNRRYDVPSWDLLMAILSLANSFSLGS
ncbi:hypothetical protein OIU84_001254 [Salix udensis]|uniref:R13L1/DRL21-like LRR repeat region domain-containing protein n=1 Tax=Salix udensis TaxID=889485 RepID=A0AAD6K6L8_9ROSI|nr:hypothetical protein OIU84_001254 [Salix udensis]